MEKKDNAMLKAAGVRRNKMDIDPEAIIADGFDDAIIGQSWDSRVVYDGDKCIEILMKEIIKQKMPEEEVDKEEAYQEALEYLEHNTFCAYVGNRTPIFVFLCEEPLL